MSGPWLQRSKLTPPAPPGGWRRRPWAAGPPRAPVTLLVGGPGYGKTLGLLDFVEAARQAGTPILWYTADSRDTDAATLFHHLIAGVEVHIPQFGEPVRALIGSAGGSNSDVRRDPARLWQGFFDALAAFNLPAFVIALDDFQHLQTQQPELIAGLAYFFDKLPPGVRLLVATRKRLDAPLGRLRARGKVEVLDQDRLRFDDAETASFLATRADARPVPAAWGDVAARLDGWPLGLDLACRGDGGKPSGSDENALHDYAREELYLLQAPDRQAFMLRAAVLQEVTADACRHVFDAEGAADALAALEADHLIQGLAGHAGYRFPPYLIEVLRAEAARVVPAAQLAEWHRRAARYHHAAGRLDQALPHAVAGGEWEIAREACRELFPAMRYDGRQGQVRLWLDAWAPAVAMRDPWIQLWRGHLHGRAGESAQALAAYELARRLYEVTGDAEGAFAALVGQCNTALTLQDDAAFARLSAEATGHPGPRGAADQVDLWLIRAYDGERRGDLPAMRACNEAALEVQMLGDPRLPSVAGTDVEVAAGHTIALMNLSTHAFYQGDLAAARRSLERAVIIAESWPFYAYRLSAAFLLAHLRLTEGDVDGAGALIGELPPTWRDVLDWHDLAVAETVLGHWHQARGDLDEAEAAIGRALEVFERAGFREGRPVPLERLMWLTLARERPARVIELAEAETREHAAAPECSLHDLALALPHARALHLAGRPSLGLAVLEAAIPALERLGARLHLARGRLFEAASRLAMGDRPGAEAAHAAATTLIEAGGFGFLRTQDRRLWQELAPLSPFGRGRGAAADGGPRPGGPPPPNGRGGTGLLAPPRTGLLALRCFGSFEVRLDGVLLDQWPRRKAKLLLAALALHPAGLRTGDLADLIGGEEANPLNVLRVNTWALRRALEPQLAKGEHSAYLRREGDRYRLAWDLVAEFDVHAFETALAAAEPLRASTPREAVTRLEQGLALVRGPLFDDGPPFDLFEADRERYRQQAIGALIWIAGQHRRVSDYGRAEAALKRAAVLAPCDESVYEALMRMYRALGDIEGVRRAYWDCRRAQKTYLAATPSGAFEALYRQLVGGGPLG